VTGALTPLPSILPSWSPLDAKFGWSFFSGEHNSCVVLSIVASLADALSTENFFDFLFRPCDHKVFSMSNQVKSIAAKELVRL
jgi:hypothetical protein